MGGNSLCFYEKETHQKKAILQSLRFFICGRTDSWISDIQCGAVSGNVNTVNCLCDSSQSKTTSCVLSKSDKPEGRSALSSLLSFFAAASCRKRCGVPTAIPIPGCSNCFRCSATEPFFGKSLAARTLRLASCFNTATARRAEIQTIT